MATAVTFDLFARDHASGAFVKVGQAAQKTGREVEQADRKTRGLSGSMTAVSRVGPRAFGLVATGAKAAALGLGALAAAGGVAFVGFIKEAEESAKISRITENAIRATGGAAKISASQVGALAMAISNKTGIDDEAIQSGANLLLTFKAVRNEVGRGNDIFNRATRAATDLSAAGFGSLDSASKMLGKALNDPLKGMTALGRAGVTFTAQQKTQIETLVKSGKVLEAQKIILKEVESQVGGAAAAAASPMQKLRTIVGNLGERLGGYLLPFVNQAATWLGKNLPVALDRAELGVRALVLAFREGDVTSDGFVGAMERIGNVARTAWLGIKALVAAFREGGVTSDGFVGAMERVGIGLRVGVDALKAFSGWVIRNRDVLIPLVAGVGAMIAAVKIWIIVTKAFTVVQAALNVVLALNPIGAVILLLVGIAAAIVVAYKRSETFRNVVQTAWRGIQAAASIAWGILRPIFAALVAYAKAVGAAFTFLWSRVLQPTFRFIVTAWLTVVGAIINGAARALGWIPGVGPKLKAAAAAFNRFRDQVNSALGGVRSRTVRVTAELATGGSIRAGGRVAMADGGILRSFASGSERHVAQIARPGAMRLWAEPETGGEAYIPLAQAKRGRSTQILGAVANRFGYGLAPMADGGLLVESRLSGLAKFEKALDAFNDRVDGMARKLALASGGPTSPGLNGALSFARSQAGKPYIWGGVGPGGYDCSGFISAVLNVALGRSPYSRLFATGSMPAGQNRNRFGGAFRAGWFTGNPGHTAGTINGVNIESRGGDGVVVGPRARGWNSPMFNRSVSFAQGGILPGDPPWDLLSPRGRHTRPGLLEALVGVQRGHTAMAGGGVIREPVMGIGRSGATYSFGERGPETVTPGIGGGSIHIHLHGPVYGTSSRELVRSLRPALREALIAEGKAVAARSL